MTAAHGTTPQQPAIIEPVAPTPTGSAPVPQADAYETKRLSLTQAAVSASTSEEKSAAMAALRAHLANDPTDQAFKTADEMASAEPAEQDQWAESLRDLRRLKKDFEYNVRRELARKAHAQTRSQLRKVKSMRVRARARRAARRREAVML